jgi:hypothetical protein
VHRIFGTCVVLLYLAATPLVIAQNPPMIKSSSPPVTISVHDYADVPGPLLVLAETQASRIFRHAGLETIWFTCGPRVEAVESKACYLSDPTHLVLKILSHAVVKHVRDRNDVLGSALLDENGIGYNAYAFYDSVRSLADRRGFSHELLGVVFAHEIGHLLLGSHSHSVSGVMCARWQGRELLDISEGTMSFLPAQSRSMRDRLIALQ